jgi:hypothetical protein
MRNTQTPSNTDSNPVGRTSRSAGDVHVAPAQSPKESQA